MLTAISFPHLGITVNLSREAFSIGGFTIYWYGAIIAFGFLLAILYCMRRTDDLGLKQDDVSDAILVTVPLAIVGARLYYVLFHFSTYFGAEAVKSPFNIRDGGIAIYGGVIATVISVFFVVRYKKHKLLPYLDLASMGLIIGQCVGRWGNFFNCEAFGDYTDSLFAMRLPLKAIGSIDAEALQVMKEKAVEGGYAGFVQVHPTFFYESMWNLVGFIIIHILSKKRTYDGQIFLLYLAWYGLGRVWIEGLRTDSLMWGGFRVSQVVAALCVLIAGGLLVVNLLKNHDPKRMFVNQK